LITITIIISNRVIHYSGVACLDNLDLVNGVEICL